MQIEERPGSLMKVLLVLLVDSIFGIFVGLGLLLLCAVLLWSEWLGESMIGVLPFVCAALGGALSGFCSGKALGRGLLTGLVQGIMNFACLYLLGLLVFVRLAPSSINPYLFLSCVIGSVVGGMLSAGRFRKYKRIHH